MAFYLKLLIVGMITVSFLGCSSKNKKSGDISASGSEVPLSDSDIFGSQQAAQDATDGAVQDVTNWSNTAMSFDPNGSDSGAISGLQTVNFGFNSANFGSEAQTQLAANAEWIKSHPSVRMRLEGHCDARGSTEYNLALGEKRANMIKNYLISLGVSSTQLETLSYGEEKLAVEGDSEYAHGKNRRVNFVPLSY